MVPTSVADTVAEAAASTDFDDDSNASDEWDVPDDLGDAADGEGELGSGNDDDDNGGNDAAGQLARQRAEAVYTARMLTVAEGQGLVP